MDNHESALVYEVQEEGLRYRQLYLRQVFINLILAVALLVVLFFDLIWDMAFKKEPLNYAITNDLRVIELIPLSDPIRTSEGIGNWAVDSITRILTLDFQNLKQQLADQKDRFSERGWGEFLKALQSSGLIDLIQADRLVTSVTLQNAARITAEGLGPGGRYAWQIEVPVIISFESSQGRQPSISWLATMRVQRVSQASKPVGVEIEQVIISNYRGP